MEPDRRRVLGAIAGTLSVTIAGCSGTGGGGNGDGDDGGGGGYGGGGGTTTTGTTTSTTAEPAADGTTETAETQTPTETATESPTDTRTPTDTTTTGGGSTTASVSIPGFEFDPVRIEVDPGTTVEWTNNSGAPHNVVSDQFHDKAVEWSFESATLDRGQTTTYSFETEGVYEYFCSIHGASTMSGAVLVGDVTLDQSLPSEDDGGY